MDGMDELMAQLTPEQLQELLGLGGLHEQGGILQQQMAQAEALRGGPGRQYETGAGAGLGSIAQVIRGVRGGAQQAALREQQMGLIDEKTRRRMILAELLRQPGQPAELGPDELAPLVE